MAINYVITADIGGTNTRIAIVKKENLEIKEVLLLKTSEITDIVLPINTLLEEAYKKEKIEISECALGVAGEVKEGNVKLTNADLTISTQHILQNSLLGKVILLNDAQAAAYGVLNFDKTKQKKAVITLGTGLGTAIIHEDSNIEATEQGHLPLEHSLKADLKKKLKREPVWEDILSSRGLEYLYYKNTKKKAKAREISDSASLKVIRDVFLAYLLQLKHQGVESIYLTGGLINHHKIITKKVRESIDSIPLTIIEDELLAVKGCAYALKIGK